MISGAPQFFLFADRSTEMTPVCAVRAAFGTANEEDVCKQIVKKGLSVRKVEQLVKDRFNDVRETPRSPRKSTDLLAVEELMQRMLGTRVNIALGQHKGKIEIEFYSTDDLNRILDLLKVRL